MRHILASFVVGRDVLPRNFCSAQSFRVEDDLDRFLSILIHRILHSRSGLAGSNRPGSVPRSWHAYGDSTQDRLRDKGGFREGFARLQPGNASSPNVALQYPLRGALPGQVHFLFRVRLVLFAIGKV